MEKFEGPKQPPEDEKKKSKWDDIEINLSGDDKPKEDLLDIESSKSYEDMANNALEEVLNELDEDTREYYEKNKEQMSSHHKKMMEILVESLTKSEESSSDILKKSLGEDYFIKNYISVFKTGIKDALIKGYEFGKKHSL